MLNLKNIVSFIFLTLVSCIAISGSALLAIVLLCNSNYPALLGFVGFLLFFALSPSSVIECCLKVYASVRQKLRNIRANFKSQESWIFLFSLGAICVGGWVLQKNYGSDRFPENIEEYGQFGDFFAGSIGTIFSFLTLVLLIQQKAETERREETKDRLQLERDNLERVKLDMEIFLSKVENLEDRLEKMSFGNLSGVSAMSVYCNPDEMPFGGFQMALPPNRMALEAKMMSFIKNLNAIFFEVLGEVKFATGINPNEISPSGYNSLKQKYEILTIRFESQIIKICDSVLMNFKERGVDYPFLMHGSLICALKEYLEKNNNDYPVFYNTEDLIKIFQISNLYRNSNLSPYTKDAEANT